MDNGLGNGRQHRHAGEINCSAEQIAADEAVRGGAGRTGSTTSDTGRIDGSSKPTDHGGDVAVLPAVQLKRFHGSVKLDATRVGRDAGRIADEVISHLAGLIGADVSVTLEIAAHV